MGLFVLLAKTCRGEGTMRCGYACGARKARRDIPLKLADLVKRRLEGAGCSPAHVFPMPGLEDVIHESEPGCVGYQPSIGRSAAHVQSILVIG